MFRFNLYNYGRAIAVAVLLASAGPVLAQTVGTYPPIETAISLPKDETSHRQPVEWWYMTGHLTGVDPQGGQRQYGFELVVFQVVGVAGLTPVYSSHFAISDLNRGQFSFEERTAPGGFSVQPDRFDQNVLGFQMGGSSGQYYAKASRSDLDYAIDFKLTQKVPVTLNGINGIETMGTFVSPYYSYTALDTKGTLWDHGVPVQITGGATWYDHEWANSVPGTDGGGWTWFGVSMADNTQYNLSFLQDSTGKVVKAIGVKTANGSYAPIPEDQLAMQEIGTWKSPHTGYTYARSWRLTLPGGTIAVVPKIQDSELSETGHHYYYEGPASVTGTINGQPATGNAYAEVNPHGVESGVLLP
ncbi:carotenoid 1,2-hydratase [Burkholderia glumae]|uniref:carotenoid 1,2-hydratase n=1 Tax=Burkholderia glumae TaxID=337 RepID=UPI0015947E84|nr:carotenoid 1,2-hydratase [Burkholderia glumae]NVE25593.1 carotenoid 1,2-hydratase [Burkholderia glumae]